MSPQREQRKKDRYFVDDGQGEDKSGDKSGDERRAGMRLRASMRVEVKLCDRKGRSQDTNFP